MATPPSPLGIHDLKIITVFYLPSVLEAKNKIKKELVNTTTIIERADIRNKNRVFYNLDLPYTIDYMKQSNNIANYDVFHVLRYGIIIAKIRIRNYVCKTNTNELKLCTPPSLNKYSFKDVQFKLEDSDWTDANGVPIYQELEKTREARKILAGEIPALPEIGQNYKNALLRFEETQRQHAVSHGGRRPTKRFKRKSHKKRIKAMTRRISKG